MGERASINAPLKFITVWKEHVDRAGMV